ncbi:RNA polymerase sigma factor [Candidatus Woesearchaeota archaeon]|nr:RNA polymerase sigma factor [Candidatus Woesearchaeota archaeon]
MSYTFQTYTPLERRFSDSQAVLAIAKQTPESNSAYTEIFKHYYDPLLTYAIKIVKDRQEAEDIISTVLGEKFYANKDKLAESAGSGDLKLRAWLYRVTTNLCFNVVRDRKRRGGLLVRRVGAQGEEDRAFSAIFSRYFGTNAPETVYARQVQETVTDAMTDLSELHQEVLQLRYGEDLSYQEIADTLGIKIGTVMSRLNRAKIQLLESAPDLEQLLAA